MSLYWMGSLASDISSREAAVDSKIDQHDVLSSAIDERARRAELQSGRLFARERDRSGCRCNWALEMVIFGNVRVEGPASRPTACLIVSEMVIVVS